MEDSLSGRKARWEKFPTLCQTSDDDMWAIVSRFRAQLLAELACVVGWPSASCQEVRITIDTATHQRSLAFNDVEYRSFLTSALLEKELGTNYRIEEYKKEYFKDPRHGKRFGHDAYVLVIYDSLGIAFKGRNRKELNQVYWYHESRDSILAQLERANSWMRDSGTGPAPETVVNLFALLNETTVRQIPQRPLSLALVINGAEVTDSTFQEVVIPEPEIRVPLDTMFGLAAWESSVLGLRFSCAYPDPLSMRRDQCNCSYGRFLFMTLDKRSKEFRRAEFLLMPVDP